MVTFGGGVVPAVVVVVGRGLDVLVAVKMSFRVIW
jgi:hypothetical protein